MNEGMTKRIIGVDIGGTNFRIGAVDGKGNVEAFAKLPVSAVLKTDDVLADLSLFIKNYIQSHGFEVSALSMGFPAPLDRERKRVLQAPNVAFMENLPVVERLEKALGIPVFIERDVNMLLCCDMAEQKIEGEGVTCAFYFGTGLGNAISIDGHIFVGKNGAAGELGHIPVDGSDEICGCGNLGCMENLAAGKYLARLSRETYPDTPLSLLFTRHGKDELLLRFVDRMAMAVATELNILDPDHVIVGGGVVNMKDFPKPLFESQIRFHARKPYPAESVKIIYASEKDEKGVVGAALYAAGKLKI